MKLLSIIVPFYKSSSMIGKLLDSIPDVDDVEILVVDDCSPDEEYNKLVQIASIRKNAIISRTPSNMGAGTARNVALRKASGKWIMFADSDDYFTPWFYHAVKSHYESSSDIIFFNATSIKLPSAEASLRHARINRLVSNDEEEQLRYAFHGPVCKMIKSNLIKKHDISFFESKAFNDALFSAKVGYYAKDIEIDKTTIYCITESSCSTTYTVSLDVLLGRIEATLCC